MLHELRAKYGISKSTLDYWRKQLLNTQNNPENEIARLRKDISGVPKSTFFYKPHEEKPDSKRCCTKPGYSRTFNDKLISDEAIATLLFALAEEYPFFGYKKLTFLLSSEFGIKINKKKVYRLCKEMDLLLPVKRHYRYEDSTIAFKKVSVNAPNTHWQMDITYITIFPRIIFVLGIIDTYTLEIVGYKVDFSITKHNVIKTVLGAMGLRRIQGRLVIRTDNGLQFKSKEFEEFCKRQGLSHERIPVKSPERNPNIERFSRTLKEEFVNINDFGSYGLFFKGFENYIEFYNFKRPHETLRYMTPNAFYEAFLRNNATRGVLAV